MNANLVKAIVGSLIIGGAVGALEWLMFGFSFAAQYLYLSIGIVVAVISVVQAIRRLTRRETTLRDQFMSALLLEQVRSSTSGKLRLALLLVKERPIALHRAETPL